MFYITIYIIISNLIIFWFAGYLFELAEGDDSFTYELRSNLIHSLIEN